MTNVQMVSFTIVAVEVLLILTALCWPRRRWPANSESQRTISDGDSGRKSIAERV
ncbi:hypothetical protein ACFVMC_28665 [Nocardia sp. NPDC127579]|uniref:hypothetical protein n=1 Tax=Nocardia sp. NPDC127579 TaxID=3345402 RepID=UPI00364578D6